MSYLTVPRIVFSGRFQADVSTVNNDVRHYDNTAFEPIFQEPMTNEAMNGWWNPDGTGAFRLIDVQIKQSITSVGQSGAGDLATGLFLNAQINRSAAKLVDLDPQFQMGSSIWGLRVALTDGETEYMRGDYLAAPFRDLFFGRVFGMGGSGGASAKYTSVLENVEWHENASASPVLSALMAASRSNENRLSANFMTFGYIGNSSSKDFTYGNLTGSIGEWTSGSPRKFISGRRFAPVPTPAGPFANEAGIGFFDGVVDGNIVSVDLSNGLPLKTTSGEMHDLGILKLCVLKKADDLDLNRGSITPSHEEGATVSDAELVEIGEITYRDADWLMQTGGLVDFNLPSEAMGLIADHPLALISPQHTDGHNIIRIRETNGGFFVRMDDMELRVDTVAGQTVGRNTKFYATCYGFPAKSLPLRFALNPPEAGQGGSGNIKPPAPQAPIPLIGTPADAVHFNPIGQTDINGTFELSIGFDALNHPRGYIDGQIFKINYQIPYSGTSSQTVFDSHIVCHVRDAHTVPDDPDWETDVKPIMEQFGNLYPIMSKGLFSFDDEATVGKHARLLIFAFMRPLADPNHMPVTRDLSEGKRKTIVKWLTKFLSPEESTEMASITAEFFETTTVQKVDVPLDPVPVGKSSASASFGGGLLDENDGKSNAARDMLTAQSES